MSTTQPFAKVLVVLLAMAVLGVMPAPPVSAQVAGAPSGDGTVFGFGAAPLLGSTEGTALRSPVVAMAATATGLGYWLVAADGGVFAFGDAVFAGSTGGMPLNQPIVGGGRAKDGYFMVARDGGVFAFGAAPFLGSTGGIPLRRPIVGMATTATGLGYWLVGADGGIFAYGDAGFHGSTSALPLSRPIVAMAATPTGAGYWLVGADGGVFAFGDAPSMGSAVGAVPSGRQVMGITRAAGAGFWLVAGQPAVTLGAVGPGVENLQRRLFDLGYWGPVDGRFGSLTTQQVYAFQKVKGLPRDGVLDAAEMAVLEQAGRPIARGGTGGRSVEVDKTRQVLFVLRDGQVEWTFNTSTGNNRPYGRGAVAVTPEGRFTFTRQINALRISPLGALFRPKYFVGGYAIHGSPSVPPFPASHGCVRLTNAAINFIWDQNVIPLGTPLWVYS